jgi:hypothetical protein
MPPAGCGLLARMACEVHIYTTVPRIGLRTKLLKSGQVARGNAVMLQRIAFFGVVCFWLAAAGGGLCQSAASSSKSYRVKSDTADQIRTQGQAATDSQSLPDAPSALVSTERNASAGRSGRPQLSLAVPLSPGSLRETNPFSLTVATTPPAAIFEDPAQERREQSQKEPSFILSKYFYRSTLPQNLPHQQSTSDTLLGRATDAASRVLLPRDETGKRKLNTLYLTRVLSAVVIHAAARPSWRRTGSEPFSDFASTVGNDTGMNVLHEFEPGLKQMLSSHTPRFISGIQERLLRPSTSHR